MKDIGLNLVLPSDEIIEKVSKEKQIIINGFFLKSGTKIKLRVFDKEITGMLYFDENKKMLLFKEKKESSGFNILGYIWHITEIDDVIVDVL